MMNQLDLNNNLNKNLIMTQFSHYGILYINNNSPLYELRFNEIEN